MRNKKANVFSALLVFALVALFAYGSVQLMVKRNDLGDQIGTKQFQLLDAYSKGETALFFVDASAKESMKEAAMNIHEKLQSSCGIYWGEQSYDSECSINTRACFPTESAVKDTFLTEFKNSMNSYVVLFNEQHQSLPITLPSTFELKTRGKTEILGKASDSETVNVNLPNIRYSVKTSFRQEINLAVIEELDKLITIAKEIFEEKISDEDMVRGLLNRDGFSADIISISITSTDSQCTHSFGNEECETCDKETGLCETHSEKETVDYTQYEVSFRAKSKEQLLAYNGFDGYESKHIEYPFKVIWIDEGKRETTC